VGFVQTPTRIVVEFVRQGGKGQFAAVEAVASPARTFSFASAPTAWATPAEKSEYEPHLLHGLLVELMPGEGVHVIGMKLEIVAARTDEVGSSAMAFFQAGRMLALRLLASENRSGQPCWKEGL
jgi:hypothetical protein